MNDNELDQLLRDSADDAGLPARFRPEVWTRIAIADERSFAGWLRRFVASLVQPVPATASVVASVLVGVWLGTATVQTPKEPKLSYAESISPFLGHGEP
jgi:hypothetical protein